MTRRILAITVAVLLAALGTAGGLYLVVSADRNAQSRLQDAVTVMVSTRQIPAGTTGAQMNKDGMYQRERMPRALVPAAAVFEIDAELSQRVVTATIPAGQILLRSNFGDASQATNGLALPDGKMAVTVETGAPEQVAGYVQAGSQVTIFLTYRATSSAGGAAHVVERTRVLLPRVLVLAVGTYQPPQGATRSNTATVRSGALLLTVAVNQQEAERLIEGLNYGTLYLGLLSDSVAVQVGDGVESTDAGGDANPLFD